MLRQGRLGSGAAVVEQQAVGLLDDQEEVRVESGAGSHAGSHAVVILRQQDRVGVPGLDPGAQVRPQGHGRGEVRVVLDQRVRHVDPESGHAAVQPVRHNLAQGVPVGSRSGRTGRLPPWFGVIGACVAEVQGGLFVEEVLQVVPAPPAWGGDEAGSGPVRPDVPVIVAVAGRGLEPGVTGRGVPCDQVEQDPDAAPPGFGDERRHVFVRPVPRRDREVVRHVIPSVTERRYEARVDPEPRRSRAIRDGPGARSRP